MSDLGGGGEARTHDLSHLALPLAITQNTLAEISAEDMATMGFGEADFAPAIWNAVNLDGKQYAVPLDTHPIILYYNKDKLAAAGLIGDNGLPKDLNGIDNFKAALAKLQEGGTKWSMSTYTAGGNFQFRTIYSLLCQQDGEMMTEGEWLAGDNKEKLVNAVTVLSDWVKDGHVPSYTEYPAAIALFTSGEAAMHINGVWEVPTMSDLASSGKLGFEWGGDWLHASDDHHIVIRKR